MTDTQTDLYEEYHLNRGRYYNTVQELGTFRLGSEVRSVSKGQLSRSAEMSVIFAQPA